MTIDAELDAVAAPSRTGQTQNTERLRLAMRLIAVVIALLLLGLALWHPAFRHAEGHLSGRFVLPLAAAVDVLLI